jgi:recombination protein RecR
MNLPSKYLENVVNAFAQLPGIGKKTALRLSLHLLNADNETVYNFSEVLTSMKQNIKFCLSCHNIADEELCTICLNKSRNAHLICVVETLRELLAIENTNQYNGVYHILGGLISPIDGVGPNELNIESLVMRVEAMETKPEIIMAISPTIEGETTIYYLSRKLAAFEVKISTIARGVSFGGELEYADEVTLARSITARLPYQSQT